MLGEEDALSGDLVYSCTATCTSQTSSLYCISVEDFQTLKSNKPAWTAIVDKSLWKERQKLVSPVYKVGEDLQATRRRMRPAVYDISDGQFTELHKTLDQMQGVNYDYQYKDRNGCYRTDR